MKKFQRNIEDFKCLNCQEEVSGDGYTNHCPSCLWSKHVDVNPGDRIEECCGAMKPIEILKEGEDYKITHKCEKCGYKKKNKLSENDDFEKVMQLVAEINEK